MAKRLTTLLVGIGAFAGALGLGEKVYSQVTPDSVIVNMLRRPNIQTSYGKGKLSYFGSGDDGNDTLDGRDVDSMLLGSKSYYFDLNADNVVNGDDAKILEDYLDKKITHLPTQWEVLTPEEKRDLALKVYRNVYMKEHDLYVQVSTGDSLIGYPNWTCSTYSRQAFMENFGVLNIDDYLSWLTDVVGEPELKFPENVAKFNLPMYICSTTALNREGHDMPIFFVGENLNFEVGKTYGISNFLIIDGQSGNVATPGSTYMASTNNHLTVSSERYTYNPFTNQFEFMREGFLTFDLDSSVLTCTFVGPKLLEEMNRIVPRYRKTGNFSVSYDYFKEKGLEAIVADSLPTGVHDDYDLAPTTSYSYNSGQTESGSCSDFTFDVSVTFTAKNRFNKENVNSYTISVEDKVKPWFTFFPQDITLEAEDAADGLDPSKTGYATTDDNTGISHATYNYVPAGESDTQRFYNNEITATDPCGNDSTRIQKVTVNKPSGIDQRVAPAAAVYPNPATGQVAVTLGSSCTETVCYSLYSAAGYPVRTGTVTMAVGQPGFAISTNGLAAGVYTLDVTAGSRRFSARLVVSNR